MNDPLAGPARPADESLAPRRVTLTIELTSDAGWPPYATETVPGHLLADDVAEIAGIPLYADGFAVGDRVRVTPVGDALHVAEIVGPGRHSTVRVVAVDAASLAVAVDLVAAAGFESRASDVPAVLAVDVPGSAGLEDLLVRLDFASSISLTYTVSCLRHRLTPHGPDHVRTIHDEFADLVDDRDLAEARPALDQELRGRVVRPGDPEWDAARGAWNLAVDQRPDLVVEVADAFDVQAVVRHAARTGLRVAPQSTGHNASALGDLDGTILVRTAAMCSVDVDVEARSVRVGAGAVWADVTAALAPHGLVALAGSAPDVGVAGYSLGGGYSWLGRRHGLASSSVTAVELVTGDGAFHRVDADNEPDLFWAVRGGGANVGVVCALEFDVLPVPTVYAGVLGFPLDRASEILTAYAAWAGAVDDTATTCIRLIRIPPMPEIPEPLRGNAFVLIDGALDADEELAAETIAPLRALGPVLDTFGPMPSSQLGMVHMDPPQPVPAAGDGMSLVGLTPEVVQTLVDRVGPGVDSALLTVDLRHLGGALGRPDPRGGAVDHLAGDFLLYAVGIAPTPEAAARVGAEVSSLLGALAPWAAERDYLNFREVTVPVERLYPPGCLHRLQAARERHDPRGVLVPAQAV